jgi:hypothetical protein
LDAAPNPRPPVPGSTHRTRKLRRLRIRVARYTAGGLILLSVLLAVFVHKGLLGIGALVSAVVVAAVMLHPRKWLRPDDDEDFTEE